MMEYAVMLQSTRATMTTIHNPCEQRGLICSDDSQQRDERDYERSARFALDISTLRYLLLGLCWGATRCWIDLTTGLATGRSVILWSDHPSHTSYRDSGRTSPAATSVNNIDPCGHG